MNIPDIPEAATEIYLKHLADQIVQQLKGTKNKHVKKHLQATLQEIQKRIEKYPKPHEDRDLGSSEQAYAIDAHERPVADNQASSDQKKGRYITIPDIPEAATEDYLKHLADQVVQQLQETNAPNVKKHLHATLQELQKRIDQSRQTHKDVEPDWQSTC